MQFGELAAQRRGIIIRIAAATASAARMAATASGEGPNGFSFESSLISVAKKIQSTPLPAFRCSAWVRRVCPLAIAPVMDGRFQAGNLFEGQMPEFARRNIQLQGP